jgi:glucose-1-phosphate thymidylyltransferase
MSDQSLKIVIPMAGLGVRLRPHTWSKPKQLIRLASKTVLDHVLDTFYTLPDPRNVEYIFIVGYLGAQIQAYMQATHPELRVRFVEQPEMRGQSHAILLAREFLHGPMLMVFADTLLETDLSFLAHEPADAVAWVKAVPDPRRFGVAVVGDDGWVSRLIEKPQDVHNNLVVVGFYYFKDSTALVSAIEEQIRRECLLRGLPEPSGVRVLPEVMVGNTPRRPVHFQRFRSKRVLAQPDTNGSLLELVFPDRITGPVALGFACHYGLGLFAPVD